jgi:hypothetical protein
MYFYFKEVKTLCKTQLKKKYKKQVSGQMHIWSACKHKIKYYFALGNNLLQTLAIFYSLALWHRVRWKILPKRSHGKLMIRWSGDIENYCKQRSFVNDFTARPPFGRKLSQFFFVWAGRKNFPLPFGTECGSFFREYFYWQYFIAPKSGSLNYVTCPIGACPRV